MSFYHFLVHNAKYLRKSEGGAISDIKPKSFKVLCIIPVWAKVQARVCVLVKDFPLLACLMEAGAQDCSRHLDPQSEGD